MVKDLGGFLPVYRDSGKPGNERQYWKRNVIVIPGIASTAADGYGCGAFVAPCKMQIVGVDVICVGGGVVAHAANYATFLVENLGSAGIGTDVVASRATDTVVTDNISANVPWALVLDKTTVKRGEVVRVAITKSGSGVAVYQMCFVIKYKAIE